MDAISRRQFVARLGSASLVLGLRPLVSLSPKEAQTADTLYFSDLFNREADTFKPPWWFVHQQKIGRIVTTNEVRPQRGTHCCKMTALATVT